MQKIMINRFIVTGLLLLVVLSTAIAQDVQFDKVTVRLEAQHSKQQIEVEFAKTFVQRAQGLMYRESLCADCGMLFAYRYARIGSMWMKNTLIPLDVAFVDKAGVITDIFTMQPHDLTAIQSSKEVVFALEMNKGWFAKQGFSVGDKMRVLEN